MKYFYAVFGSIFATIVIIFVFMYFGYNNQHVDYHTRYEAEEDVVETRLDNMWKIISDKFSMSQQYADDFKEVAKVNATNFGQGGDMWKWVQANYPQLDANIYKDVMASIESERKGLENAQKKIIDICREHNNLIAKVPSSWFISDKEKLEWNVISSKDTKNIMITREDERTLDNLRNS